MAPPPEPTFVPGSPTPPPAPENTTRLHRRLIRHSLAVLLIPAVSIPLLSMTYLYRESLKSQREQGVVKAAQHTRYIESLLIAKGTETLVVGQFPETRRHLNAETPEARARAIEALRFRMQAFLASNQELFSGFVYLDRLGHGILRLGDGRPEPESADFSSHPAFVGAMHLAAIQGQPLPVYFHHAGPGEPIVFSTLLKDDEGIISGVVLLEMNLEGLLAKFREGSPGEILRLIDDQGRSLFSSTEAGTLETSFPVEEVVRRREGVIASDAWFPEQARVFSRIQPPGQSAIRWTAVYAMPLTTLDSSFRNALWMIGGVTLVSLVVSVALASSLSRRITRPVVRLAEAAKDIAHGYWDTLVPEPETHDEIGMLTRSFSSMSRQLRAAQESLMRNIEELRASEAHLTEESERLGVTLRSIGDAVIATDLDGRIRLLNPVAETLLAVESDQALGTRLSDAMSLKDPVSDETIDDLVATVGTTSHSPEGGAELKLTNHEGREFTIESNATIIRDASDEAVGVVIVLRDVTRIREVARERNRMEKLESLGVLTGGIAHDFNNLMSVILGDLSLLNLKLDPGDRNYPVIQNATRAAVRARELTRQLMTFSKGGSPVKETKSLPSLIRESAEFALHGTNCTCDIDAADSLWPAEVDAAQIHQVFHNLVLNARQAMPEGGVIRIRLSNVRVETGDEVPVHPGAYLRVEVIDAGVGIPPNEINRIFDPYFTTKETGSGLGLSSVFSIVQSHGGHIGVESSGAGTTFTLHLPANDQAAAPSADGEREAEPAPPAPIRILVLDDEPGIRLTTRRLLEHLGHEVETTATGQDTLEAFEKARENGAPFDLLLLDLTIPGGMGGREVLRNIRESGSNVKVIVSSGYSHDDIMANFADHGFDGMIQKPYSIKELSRAVREVMAAGD